VAAAIPGVGGDLLELLAEVPDGRPGQGRDHPKAVVLALAAAAVAAGMRSFTAIAGWAADVPAGLLAELYKRGGAARAPAGPPHDLARGNWSRRARGGCGLAPG
jgi:DDE_Tnp_1-associated